MSTTKVTDAMIDGVAASKLTGALPAISGASLTALNATELTSGTLPDARLPATLPAKSGVNLTALNASNLGSGTASVARGGTGAGTHTANNVLVGNGTSAIASIAPSTSGNVLTSNGSAWASTAAAGGGKILQVVNVVYTTEQSSSNTFPLDTTAPQNSEGTELMTAAITCSSTSSSVLFFCSGELGSSAGGGQLMVALFKNSDASALHVQTSFRDDASYTSNYGFQYEDNPSSVSEQTYKLRYGSNTATSYVNKSSDSSAGMWGGLMAWRITLMELADGGDA